MSGWGLGWFGGGTAKKKDAPKNAILQLRATYDMLTKREKHLQNQMEEQDTIARKFVTTNKAAAKAALRRKKQYESAMENTSAQMMTIEREISGIEAANINKETLDALKNASVALKGIHGDLTIDKVDKIMEDLGEQQDVSKEISEAITQGARADAIDDEELEEELQGLQQEVLDGNMLSSGNVPIGDEVSKQNKLPSVTDRPLPGKTYSVPQTEEDEEEEELRRLQAEMAM